MNNFKQTDIGLIPEDWDVKDVEDILLENNFSRINQINSSEIKEKGLYPVIDQGQEQIAGYSDEKEKLFKQDSPVIVFGDHTRIFKYVDFPFIVGADGTKILRPDPTVFDPKFFYFFSLSLNIPSRGYNRHYKILKEQKYLKPPLPEQKKIAYVLSKIQQAIETQEQIIKTTQELKKALMQKLFTEGLNGEPQKQSALSGEIGLIPESWEVIEIINCVEESETRNPSLLPNKYIKYIDVSSVSNQSFSVVDHQYVKGKEAPGRARKVVKTNDIIFATIRPTLKRIAKIKSFYDDEYCSTAFCVLRCKSKILYPEFLFQYLITDFFIERIGKLQSGASYPAVRDDNVKEMIIPLPQLKEQKEIARILSSLDGKIEFHSNNKIQLQDLFKSMLSQLMTGQIRVKDIEFDIDAGKVN